MDWPKTIENVIITLVLAVIAPFFANSVASLTEFYGKQRLFFTEVQDHKPESSEKYFNVVSLINSSGHKFEKLTLNLKSTTSPGSSAVTRCFFDSEGDRGGSRYKSCPRAEINTGTYDIEIEEFSPYAKFTVAIESDNEFEIGGTQGTTKTKSYGISVNINGKTHKIKKLNRNYILTWSYGYVLFSLIGLIIGLPIYRLMNKRPRSFYSTIFGNIRTHRATRRR